MNRAKDWFEQAKRDLLHAHPSGAPYKFYTENDAKEAIAKAQEVIDFCASHGLKNR